MKSKHHRQEELCILIDTFKIDFLNTSRAAKDVMRKEKRSLFVYVTVCMVPALLSRSFLLL
jgi:hypothetical protein